MNDWQVYPKVTVEVSEGDAAQLLGFDGVDGLEGWKVFKKIGRAFKKVGKAIKKVVSSKVFKIALPIAGVFFAPLAIAKIGSVAKTFGGTVGRLVSGGKTKAIVVKTASGAKKVGLVSPAEYDRFKGVLKNPADAVSESVFRNLIGEGIDLREAVGAVVKGNQVEFPVANQPTVVSSAEIPVKRPALAGIPPIALIAGAALIAMSLGRKGK